MNLKETLLKLKNDYREQVKRVNAAAEITAKIDPLLPEGWESKYDGWITLEIEKVTPASVGEMMLVRKLVSQATGQEVVLQPSSSGKKLYGIFGTVSYDYEDGDSPKYIYVKIYATKPECKIEIRSKGSELVEQFEVIVDETCLGIYRQEEEK